MNVVVEVRPNTSASDCPLFFNNETCSLGFNCELRHCPSARGAKLVCKSWKSSQCNNNMCTFRHIAEAELVCAQDGTCIKPACPYKHIVSRRAANGEPITTMAGIEELHDLLAIHKLGNHSQTFRVHDIDLDVFVTLDEKDIESQLPSIQFADRRRLMVAKQKYLEFLEEKKKQPGKGAKTKQATPATKAPAPKPVAQQTPTKKQPPPPHPVTKANLFVGNLDKDVDDERLRKEFQQFGSITRCQVIRDENGNSKCFAFIYFTNENDSTHAQQKMDSRILYPYPNAIRVSFQNEKTDNPGSNPQLLPQGSQSTPNTAKGAKNKKKNPDNTGSNQQQLPQENQSNPNTTKNKKNAKGRAKPNPPPPDGSNTQDGGNGDPNYDENRYLSEKLQDIDDLHPTGNVVVGSEFYCELCDVKCASQANLKEHKLGSKHLKKENTDNQSTNQQQLPQENHSMPNTAQAKNKKENTDNPHSNQQQPQENHPTSNTAAKNKKSAKGRAKQTPAPAPERSKSQEDGNLADQLVNAAAQHLVKLMLNTGEISPSPTQQQQGKQQSGAKANRKRGPKTPSSP